MDTVLRHVTRCLLAGALAILPVGGLVLALVLAENTISGPWRKALPVYFPGLGILLALAAVYVLGLLTTSFLGRWFWRVIDRLLEKVPALGRLYVTLKQVLGYGAGEKALFRRVVLVPSGGGGHELGLVTNEVPGPDGRARLLVFVPGSPNPTGGRLVLAEPTEVVAVATPVHEALRALLAAGSAALPLPAPGSPPRTASG